VQIKATEYNIRIIILEMDGRLDAFNSPKLRTSLEEYREQGVIRFILNLSHLEFMDSAGMAVLVTHLKHVRQENGEVRLVLPASEAARRILRLTRFDRIFDCYETIEEARQSF
jgi:anti-anti-sigma factor